jgi:hypothetical protein
MAKPKATTRARKGPRNQSSSKGGGISKRTKKFNQNALGKVIESRKKKKVFKERVERRKNERKFKGKGKGNGKGKEGKEEGEDR